MIKLISLELKKNNLTPYLKGVLGIFLFIFFTIVAMLNLRNLVPYDKNIQMMTTISGLIQVIPILYMACFSILGAVMYSKFVVDEYAGKKNVLLFTYPQKRSSILLAKFILIFGFTFLSIFVLNIVTTLIVIFAGNYLGLVKGILTTNVFLTAIRVNFLFSMIANLVSIIALRVGFWKKSIIWTIITAVVLASPFGNMATFITSTLISIIFPIFVVLFIICSVIFISLLKKVNNMECL